MGLEKRAAQQLADAKRTHGRGLVSTRIGSAPNEIMNVHILLVKMRLVLLQISDDLRMKRLEVDEDDDRARRRRFVFVFCVWRAF